MKLTNELHWWWRYHLRYVISKRKERLLLWFVWKLPRKVAYWAAIRVGAHATTGKYGNQIVPDLLFHEALERWDKDHRIEKTA